MIIEFSEETTVFSFKSFTSYCKIIMFYNIAKGKTPLFLPTAYRFIFALRTAYCLKTKTTFLTFRFTRRI